ncbi:hypothetical protein PVL30_000534 [Lodderomyces elongisporus]|uniref:uncharacterized protein n=1 Tax=Lodderomyces elongisporus TaxID=36914 RepID=UPI00291E18E9|nr:uncharacterized protein PVL30_000534 [Lodderomyces elongisporus]WLF76830.1 hypothetical protein PVL30_000534 [Lodderomyces elongisporus]
MGIDRTDIPEELKSDKTVTSYIQRAAELNEIEPVISFYCKILVLQHILDKKLHLQSKANEGLTIKLLEDTEATKNSEEDENLNTVLKDKNLSFGVVLKFVYELFNSCLAGLNHYTAEQKAPLLAKFKATLDFFALFDIFKNSEDTLEYAKYTGGKINSWSEFEQLNKQKVKTLKYHMTRLIKNEVPTVYSAPINDADLEKELDDEIANLGSDQSLPSTQLKDEDKFDETDEADNANKKDEGEEGNEIGAHEGSLERQNKAIESNDDYSTKLPAPPTSDLLGNTHSSKDTFPGDGINDEHDTGIGYGDSDGKEAHNKGNEPATSLPGVPHSQPRDDEDENPFELPGAPTYLPDQDLSNINKTNAIHVIPRPSLEESRRSSSNAKPTPRRTTSEQSSVPQRHQKHITKENINEILNREEAIAKIQKHTKFANSALQFDDLGEAEKQLLEGIELLRVLRAQEPED